MCSVSVVLFAFTSPGLHFYICSQWPHKDSWRKVSVEIVAVVVFVEPMKKYNYRCIF